MKMSKARVIKLDRKENNNRIYNAKAEIFEDTDNLALIITIRNKKTEETLVRKWFNIEILNLTNQQEDWLARIITKLMLDSALAGWEDKSNEVEKSWNILLNIIKNH